MGNPQGFSGEPKTSLKVPGTPPHLTVASVPSFEPWRLFVYKLKFTVPRESQ